MSDVVSAADGPFTIVNKAQWTISPDRCALLIHDMQSHYLERIEPGLRTRVIANAAQIAAACRAVGVPIFASQVPAVTEARERGLMFDMWGMGPSPSGAALDEGLGLSEGQFRPLAKRSYSAFYANEFEMLLRRLDRRSILIVGVFTSIGCLASAMDAFMRDIEVFLVSDATADFSPEDHRAALVKAARTCASVTSTHAALQALRRLDRE
jgi:isochorismate hydrolase